MSRQMRCFLAVVGPKEHGCRMQEYLLVRKQEIFWRKEAWLRKTDATKVKMGGPQNVAGQVEGSVASVDSLVIMLEHVQTLKR